MTHEIIDKLGTLEGMAFIANQDAQALKVGCRKAGFFEDVARYNETNIAEMYKLIRELAEILTREEFSNVELHPFSSENVPF